MVVFHFFPFCSLLLLERYCCCCRCSCCCRLFCFTRFVDILAISTISSSELFLMRSRFWSISACESCHIHRRFHHFKTPITGSNGGFETNNTNEMKRKCKKTKNNKNKRINKQTRTFIGRYMHDFVHVS